MAMLLAFAAVVILRLGSSLIGLTTFSGVDALTAFSPWIERWSPPQVHNRWVGDTIDVVLPGYIQMFGSLWSGDLPLRTMLNGSGAPLLAQAGIPTLTPSTFVFLLTPSVWAVGFAKLVQLLMIVGGMMLWLHRVGVAWAAGAFAGLVYCGSGFFVAWSGWVGQSTVAATIPLLFWAIEYFLARRTVIAGLALSVVVAWLMLGGFPAVAGHALYAGGLYFLVRALVTGRGRTGAQVATTIGGGALAVALGLALSAVQVLPMLSSIADTDTTYRADQFHIQLPDSSAFTLFFPRLFLPTDDLPHGFGDSNPIEAYAFLGMGAAVLAALAVLAGRRSGVAGGVVPALALIGLLAAALVWHQGFWTEWLADLPAFADNRSARLRDLVALAGSALAGVGLNLLLRPDLPTRVRRRLTIAAWVLAGLALVGTIGVGVRYAALIEPSSFRADAALALVGVVLVASAFTLGRRRPDVPVARPEDRPGGSSKAHRRTVALPLIGVGLAVVTGVQVLASTEYFWPVSSRDDFYPALPAIAAAQAAVGADRAVLIGTFPGSTAGAYDLRTVTGHSFQDPAWRDVLLAIDPEAYTPPGRSPTFPVLNVSVFDGSMSNPLLDRLAASTALVSPDQAVPGPIRNLDGTPSDPLGAAESSVRVGSTPVTAASALAPMDVRAAVVQITEPVGDGRNGVELAVVVRDASGVAVAGGSQIRPEWEAGWVQIPIAGEGLGSAVGPLTVELTVRSAVDPTLRVAFGAADGGPDVRITGGQDDGLVLRYADSDMMVWQRLTALPRIRWANSTIVEPDPSARLSVLADPATPRSAVVLDAPGPELAAGSTAQVGTTLDTGDHLSVRVAADGAGYLVVADAIQSGWSATVDGEPVDLRPADHALGAVLVPAGEHVVDLRYDPLSLRIGVLVSGIAAALALGALLAGTVLRGRSGRRSSGPDPAGSAGPADVAGPSAPPSTPAGTADQMSG